MSASFLPPRDRLTRILALAVPLIGGMISQNVLNLVDTAMVGVLGDAALAAVGMGSFLTFMGTSFLTGLSAGVQAIAARRLGEGRTSETAVALRSEGAGSPVNTVTDQGLLQSP